MVPDITYYDLTESQSNASFTPFKPVKKRPDLITYLNQEKQFQRQRSQTQYNKTNTQQQIPSSLLPFDHFSKTHKIKVIPPQNKEEMALINLASKDEEIVRVKDLFVKAQAMPVSAFPQFRTYAASCGDESEVFLFGGIAGTIFNDFLEFKFPNLWKQTQIEGSYHFISSRYGASMIKHRNTVVIVAGAHSHSKHKQLLNDLIIIRLQNKKTQNVHFMESDFKRRYLQAACTLGDKLIVHGGIGLQKETLHEFNCFDLNNYTILPIITQNNPLPLCQHTMTSIFYPDIQQTFYELEASHWQKRNHSLLSIKSQGIYIFGGRDGQKVSKSLYILKTYQNPMDISEPEVDGEAPCARYGHSANFLLNQNLLVIVGGTGQNGQYLDDIVALKLSSMNWMKIDYQGQKIPRTMHFSFFREN